MYFFKINFSMLEIDMIQYRFYSYLGFLMPTVRNFVYKNKYKCLLLFESLLCATRSYKRPTLVLFLLTKRNSQEDFCFYKKG